MSESGEMDTPEMAIAALERRTYDPRIRRLVAEGKGHDIARRLNIPRSTAGVLLMTKEIPKDPAARHVIQQLVRAATSGGANYEETRAAESRSDFIHKLSIAAKETGEALYWLRLIERALYSGVAVTDLIREANQLVAILTSSIKTAKRNEGPKHRSPD